MASVITVFGSGKIGDTDPEYRKAFKLGGLLAKAGFTVATGGYFGIMEAVSRGAEEAGGKTIGVVTPSLKHQPNPWIRETVQVPSWSDRLFQLIKLGEGFVVCDGGTGTLAEMSVVWEMTNQKMLGKPIALLGRETLKLFKFFEKNTLMKLNDCLKRCASPEEAVSYLSRSL